MEQTPLMKIKAEYKSALKDIQDECNHQYHIQYSQGTCIVCCRFCDAPSPVINLTQTKHAQRYWAMH